MPNFSKLKQLIEISKKFASASTVIGLARIVRAETKFMKICWVVMTLVSLAIALFMTSGTIKDYLEYDVFTQTRRIAASSSHMPSVTFCFSNPDTEDLNSFFEKAEFNTSNNPPTNLTGEQFYDEKLEKWDKSGDCIKFNHFINRSDSKLFIA